MRLQKWLLWLLLTLIATPLWAARIHPPLSALRKPPNIAVIATIVAIRPQPPALEIKVERTLFGQPNAQRFILVERTLLARVEVGARYLLVYRGQERDRLKPERVIDRAEGTLVIEEGAAPALFRDVEQASRWLDPAHDATERAPDYRAVVVKQLASADPFLRDLWSAELVLRGSLAEQLSSQERKQVFATLADSTSLPSTRARLLEAAMQGRIQFSERQLNTVVNDALALLPTLTTDDIFNPELLANVALQWAQRNPDGIDPKVLPRWLRSPRPALAEQAALVIRAQAPDQEEPQIQAALSENLLPAGTRLFLVDHLRRLALTRQAGQ